MNNLNFGNYTRINKVKARKEFLNGSTIRMCMCKINPLNEWHFYEDINLKTISDTKYGSDYNYGFDMSYGDLFRFSEYFEKQAKKYGLVHEFKENGII